MSVPLKKRYPICDTDLWIKVCKKNTDVVFCQYEKIYISDAVLQELEYKNNDSCEEFGCGIQNYHKEIRNERIYSININSKRIFDENEKSQVIKHFLKHDIPYDLQTQKFKRSEHIGEKVSVIYAAVLNLDLVLSDDKGTGSFVDKYFKYVPVIRLKELLTTYGLSSHEVKAFIKEVNSSCSQVAASTETPSGTFKSFRELAKILKH